MLRKSMSLLVLLTVLAGLLTGCGSAAPAAESAPAPSVDEFVLQLPRLYIQYLESPQGYAEPALWGMRASLLEQWFGMDMSMVKIPEFYVDWIKASDVQHFEVVHDAAGLFAYVNGKPMPYVSWDADSMGMTGDLIYGMGVPNGDIIRRLLPLLRHVGLDIIVQMPLAQDAAIIPYRDEDGGLMQSMAAAAIDDPDAKLKLQLDIDEQGVPSLFGINAEMFGFTLGRLDPYYVGLLKGAGVGSLAVQTQGNGLFMYVNDRALPSFAWSEEHLNNALDLYEQMNEASWVPNPEFIGMVREVVRQVGNADVTLTVGLP